MERPGGTIPGSRFRRAYCFGCGEPIRVHSSRHIFSLCRACEVSGFSLELTDETPRALHAPRTIVFRGFHARDHRCSGST